MSTTPTEPVEPTAPPAQPTEPTEPPAAAVTPPVPAEPKGNVWDDPKAAQAEIERLRRENGAARTNAKAQAAEEAKNELAQTIGKALGLVENEPIDPAKLTENLTAAQAEAKRAQVALAVYQNAGAVADPVALLDSTTFLKSVEGVDPGDTAAITAAIAAAVEANPRLGAASAADPKPPAPIPGQGGSSGGPSGVAQLTRAEVEQLARDGKHAEIDKARTEGRLNDLLGIK